MSSFNQTSPLLQNTGFQAQRNNASHDNFAPSGAQAFGTQSFGNQSRSPFGAQSLENQQYAPFGAYGNQQQWNCGQNQFQGSKQRNLVDALREVEQRAQQIQDALYQERQQGNNFQAIRQTAEIIASNADISRRIIEDIKQEVRNQQQSANSSLERQAYQQREQLIEQLAQIKDQIRYLSQQRTNAQDNYQRENLSHQLVDLARQAQHLARNAINETQNNRNQIQTPFYPQNSNGNYQGNNGQFRQNQWFQGNYQQPSPYNNHL